MAVVFRPLLLFHILCATDAIHIVHLKKEEEESILIQ